MRHVDGLTPMQRAILIGIARGGTLSSIGAEMHLSPNTLKTHLSGAFLRTRAHTQAQAVVNALRLGYIAMEDIAEAPVWRR